MTVPDSDGLAHRYSRPAVTLGARINGSGLSITIQRKSYNFDTHFNRWVDGVAQPTLAVSQSGPVILPVAQNFPPGDHEIWWTHSGDAIDTGEVFQTVTLDENAKFLAPPPSPTRIIEVIGASADTGYGVLTDAPGCSGAAAQDASVTWIHRAAQALGAMPINSATAGLGTYWDYFYGHSWIAANMWPRIIPIDPTLLWDAATAPKPDAVLIDLNGNDWHSAGSEGLSSPAAGQMYTQATSRLMAQVWAAYPDTFIYLFINNGVAVERRAVLRKLFDAALASARAAGHSKCRLLEMAWSANGLAGCNDHPNLAAHQEMVEQVVAELRSTFSW